MKKTRANDSADAETVDSQQGYVIYLALVLLFVITAYTSSVILSQHLALHFPRRALARMQAEVLAKSGLSLAQAYAAGYRSNGLDGEISEITQEIEGVGSFRLAARREAGWLRVKSTGIRYRDTIAFEGLLGQVNPTFASCALTVQGDGASLTVADRARVSGDVATPTASASTRGGGTLIGKINRSIRSDCNDTTVEMELRDLARHMQPVVDSINLQGRRSKFRGPELIPRLAQASDSLLVTGDLWFDNDTMNMPGRCIFIAGDLRICGVSFVSGLRARVCGKTVMADSAVALDASITSLSGFKMDGGCLFQGSVLCAESLLVTGVARVQNPSSLVSAHGPGRFVSPVILIRDKASVSGAIVSMGFGQSSLSPGITLDGRTQVEGIVYTPGAATLFGSITGSVCVGRIVYHTPGNVYDGWLMETSLAYCDVSGMALPLLFPGNGTPAYRYVRKAGP